MISGNQVSVTNAICNDGRGYCHPKKMRTCNFEWRGSVIGIDVVLLSDQAWYKLVFTVLSLIVCYQPLQPTALFDYKAVSVN